MSTEKISGQYLSPSATDCGLVAYGGHVMASIEETVSVFRQRQPQLPVWRHFDRLIQACREDVPSLIKGFSEYYNAMNAELWSAAVICLIRLHEEFQDGAGIQLCEIHLSRAADKIILGWGRKNDIHFAASEALIGFFATHTDLGLNPTQRTHVSQFLQLALSESPSPTRVFRAAIYQGVPEILARAGRLSAIPELAREVGVPELTYPNWGLFPSIREVYGKPLITIINDPRDLTADIATMRESCGYIVYGNALESVCQAKYDAAVTLLTFLSFLEGWRDLGINLPIRK